MTAARILATCALLLLVAGLAHAQALEALSDKGSGRMFALRVAPPAPVAGTFAAKPTPTSLRATADGFIAEHRELIGIEDPARDLMATPATTDQVGLSRVKYFQTHRGLDVLGGEVAVHLNRDGQVTYVKTKVARELPADVTPRFSEAQAQDAALDRAVAAGVPLGALMVLSTRLLVLPLGMVKNEPSEATHLAWEVEVADAETRGDRFGEGYYYDAVTGALLIGLPRIHQLIPITRQLYDCAGGTGVTCDLDVACPYYPGYVHGRTEGTLPRGPNPHIDIPQYGYSDVDSIYLALGQLHDFVWEKFGIDGANGFGGAARWPNVPREITRGIAFQETGGPWVGGAPQSPCGAFYINTNSGSLYFGRFASSDWTIGHEYGHAVVTHSFHNSDGTPTTGPAYSEETGALNEGFADAFGYCFELWKSGATNWAEEMDSTACGTPVLRNSADPHDPRQETIGPHPSRFRDPYFYCGSEDQGGVHRNSTVPSHAFYLIAEGGIENGCSIQGQGADVALEIFFRFWRTYASGNASFNEAYTDLIQASTDLYPAAVTAEVTRALQAVEMDQPGLCTGLPANPPACAVVGVDDRPAPALDGLRLLGQHPTQGPVRFAYRTAHEGRVEVRIHDLVGRLLARPLRAYQLAGEQIGAWDGRLESGERAKAGAYFLSVTLDGRPVGLRKLLLLR